MTGGYVRLSRDEDKKNYISIENQKLIISQYAAKHGLTIDQWYEDDNFSGYTFGRPAFRQMMEDMEKGMDTIIAKDLSRIGRHNAKVLLFLDTTKEQGKRILLVDDNYDSLSDDDDVIGIKTWYNERYVKDTSKKIKRVFQARQQEGTLYHNVPVGYRRKKENKSEIIIAEEEAVYIRLIFELYLQGYGYRRISYYLNNRRVPTPSQFKQDEFLAEGRSYQKKVAPMWSDAMVSDILKNDFYTGTIRFHKRERLTIHGADRKVPREEQIVFENNHDPIIDRQTFELVQDLMKKRIKTNYRGQGDKQNIFGSCLFCKDCQSRLTPIVRKKGTLKKYYICNTYNSKGRQWCSHAHSVKEETLAEAVVSYLTVCRESLLEDINAYDGTEFQGGGEQRVTVKYNLQVSLDKTKKELKALLKHKMAETAARPDEMEIVGEFYKEIQKELIERIMFLEEQISELEQWGNELKEKESTPILVLDSIIQKQSINRKDVELLIDKIVVDKNGMITIELKYGLGDLVKETAIARLNEEEERAIFLTLQYVYEEKRTYTSAKYILTRFHQAGINKTKRSVMAYLSIMINLQILSPDSDPQKPYRIIKTKDEISEILNSMKQCI